MIEYLKFENPEVLAIGIAVILFLVLYKFLLNVLKNKGPSLIGAFAVSVIAAWQLYRERFYGLENALATVLIIVVVVIVFRIFWAFVKNVKRNFGK